MAGHRGISHCHVPNLGFHEQGLTFPPTIKVEIADSSMGGPKTNLGIAVEGQNLVKEIVEKASVLFYSLQNCEVLNVEETGSKDRQQRLSKTCQDTLGNLKELFSQLRSVYEESMERLPEVHEVLNTGNIEHLLPLGGDHSQMESEHIDMQDLEKKSLVKEIQQRNLKIKVLIEKFRTLIQDLNLIVQLETSQ